MALSPRRQLTIRRERLLLESAQLRALMADDAAQIRRSLSWSGAAGAGAALWRQLPWAAPAGLAALWLVWRPRRALRWASRGLWAWRTLWSLAPWWPLMRPAARRR